MEPFNLETKILNKITENYFLNKLLVVLIVRYLSITINSPQGFAIEKQKN